jgi:hypothetical protein
MTRFWPAGEPIAVACTQERQPTVVTLQRQRERVTQVLARWRVDEGWWRQRIWREYIALVTDQGRLLLIYHDLLTDCWYLQRLYD